MSAATAETQTWTAPPPDSRRWTALAFIAIAQLMIALDATIVSIALPSAQSALGASDADRQWVVTAYALAFGGLLLLGGKVADYAGRKRAFLIGLAGFAVASAIGGAAPNFATLVAARALQGAFAALLAPTALSLLAVSFTQPRERATAFAVYGSIAGSGAAIGLLLGGALTQYLAWRWCLYVNIPIAVMAGIGGWLVLPAGSGRAKAALGFPCVVLAAGRLVAHRQPLDALRGAACADGSGRRRRGCGHGAVDAAARRQRLPDARAAGGSPSRPRHLVRDGARLQHGDPRHRPARGRGCLGDREHRPADRRFAGHGSPELDRNQRDGGVRRTTGGGPGPRLLGGDGVGRGDPAWRGDRCGGADQHGSPGTTSRVRPGARALHHVSRRPGQRKIRSARWRSGRSSPFGGRRWSGNGRCRCGRSKRCARSFARIPSRRACSHR